MSPMERRQAILTYLEGKGDCSYRELEELLQVSNMTVRRDVDRLVADGEVIKTLGGVQVVDGLSTLCESSLLSRLSVHLEQKRLIALEAVKHIQPGETIYLDGSSTCLQLAKTLAKKMTGITVITNSAITYLDLVKGGENTVICIGGQHDPVSFCMTGLTTEEEAQKYFVDKAFMSTKGFLPEEGTFESSVPTFRVKQIVAKKSKELILLVDHSKFGQRSLRKVLDISEVHTVITDGGISEEYVSLLRKNVGNVYVATAAEMQPSKVAEG